MPGRGNRSGDERPGRARDRVVSAAYDRFIRSGTRAVGVDAVIADAGVAKMTLYRNFASKDDLIIAFLQRREEVWTFDWLRAEVLARESTPRARLLAIFDVFADWFRRPDFEGCSFVAVLLEYPSADSRVHEAAVRHLENIRAFIRELATAAGVGDADAFARQWHILMKGAVISAQEGDRAAAARAKDMGTLLLERVGVR
jgi:AcrR family transcriptional regulator